MFEALADARPIREWWKPVYIAVETDGPPEVGRVSQQEFKGQLPYHLKTRSEIVRYEPPERSRSRSSATSPAAASGR